MPLFLFSKYEFILRLDIFILLTFFISNNIFFSDFLSKIKIVLQDPVIFTLDFNTILSLNIYLPLPKIRSTSLLLAKLIALSIAF